MNRPSILSGAARLVAAGALMASGCRAPREPPRHETAALCEYSFADQGGATIEATLVGGDERRVVVFDPFLRKTDRNLRLASLAALDKICGRKESGLSIEDARSERHEYEFACVYWILENPNQKYCVLPIHDPESRLILALSVRLERVGPGHS